MVRGDLDQIQSCVGWLVGWLSSTPLRSRSTEQRELKGVYTVIIIKKPPRRER